MWWWSIKYPIINAQRSRRITSPVYKTVHQLRSLDENKLLLKLVQLVPTTGDPSQLTATHNPLVQWMDLGHNICWPSSEASQILLQPLPALRANEYCIPNNNKMALIKHSTSDLLKTGGKIKTWYVPSISANTAGPPPRVRQVWNMILRSLLAYKLHPACFGEVTNNRGLFN